MKIDTNSLNGFEKDIVLQWFMYKMPMDQRYEMMENFPMVYYKLTGVKPKLWTEKEESDK